MSSLMLRPMVWKRRAVCRCVSAVASISFVAANRSVHAQLVRECFLQFKHHIRFEFAIRIDFSFDLLILCQRLLDAIFRVQLWIFPLVNVIEHFEWNVEILYLMFQLVDFLQTGHHALAAKNMKIVCHSQSIVLGTQTYIFWLRTLCPCGWKSLTMMPTWRTFSMNNSNCDSRLSSGGDILEANRKKENKFAWFVVFLSSTAVVVRRTRNKCYFFRRGNDSDNLWHLVKVSTEAKTHDSIRVYVADVKCQLRLCLLRVFWWH